MKKNKKGYSLIELLLVVAVIALSMPLLFWIYMYGVQTFSTDNRHMEQHYKIINVTQRIRQDIEEAAACKVPYNASASEAPQASELTVWIPDQDETTSDYYIVKRWRLEDGHLYFKSCEGVYPAVEDPVETEAALAATGFVSILDGLDTNAVLDGGRWHMPTRFEKIADTIILSIKPVETNELAFRNRNVTKPIITEFSVSYKNLID